eukprot:m51a1_g7025 hypothetical protein (475) ;mRNA; f:55034-56827
MLLRLPASALLVLCALAALAAAQAMPPNIGNATLRQLFDRVRIGPFLLPTRTRVELRLWAKSGDDLDVRQLSVWGSDSMRTEYITIANKSNALVPEGSSPNVTFVVERSSAFWVLLVDGPRVATSYDAVIALRWSVKVLGSPNCLCSIGGIASLAMVAASFIAGIALWMAFTFAIDRHEQEDRQAKWEISMFSEVGWRMESIRKAHPDGAKPLSLVLRKPKITLWRAILCDHDYMWIFSPEPGESIPVGHRIAATVANHMFQFMVYALVTLYKQQLGDVIVIEPRPLAGFNINNMIVATVLINVSSFAFNAVYKLIFRWAWRASRKASALHIAAGVASALFLLVFTLGNTTIFVWVLYSATCSRILVSFVVPFVAFMAAWLAVLCPLLSTVLYFAAARWGKSQDYRSDGKDSGSPAGSSASCSPAVDEEKNAEGFARPQPQRSMSTNSMAPAPRQCPPAPVKLLSVSAPSLFEQ